MPEVGLLTELRRSHTPSSRATTIAHVPMSRPLRREREVVAICRVLPLVLARAIRCRRAIASIPDLRTLLYTIDAESASHRWKRQVEAHDLVRATNISLRILRAPDRSCVLRSATLYSTLRGMGRTAAFVSGVRRLGGDIDGHAWVESPSLPLSLTGDQLSSTVFAEGFRHPPP